MQLIPVYRAWSLRLIHLNMVTRLPLERWEKAEGMAWREGQREG